MPKKLIVASFLIVMFASEGLILAQEGLFGPKAEKSLVWVKKVPGKLALDRPFKALSAQEPWGQASTYAAATSQASQPGLENLLKEMRQEPNSNPKTFFKNFVTISKQVIINVILLGDNILKEISKFLKR